MYYHLILRGWDRPTITGHILEATSRVEKQARSTAFNSDKDDCFENILILHFKYQKDDISRKLIRSIYDGHFGAYFQKDARIQRVIVIYSRPKNIGDFVSKAKLHQVPGKDTRVFFLNGPLLVTKWGFL